MLVSDAATPNPVKPVLTVKPPPVVEASLAVTSAEMFNRKSNFAKGTRHRNLATSTLTPSGMGSLITGG